MEAKEAADASGGGLPQRVVSPRRSPRPLLREKRRLSPYRTLQKSRQKSLTNIMCTQAKTAAQGRRRRPQGCQ